MTHERLIEELKALSDVERQGKKYLASHGDLMHYRISWQSLSCSTQTSGPIKRSFPGSIMSSEN